MRLKFLVSWLLLWPPLLLAQFTQVQGTVTDPTGLPYSNGTILPTLVISGSPRFLSSGFPYTPPAQPVALDAKGSFVMNLANVTQLTPAGGTWSFHVCSATGTVQPGSPITSGPVCFDVTGVSVTGTVLDISALLSAAAPKLSNIPSSGGTGTVGPGVVGQYAIFQNNATTVLGSPNLDDSLTNPGVITAKENIFVPDIQLTGSPTASVSTAANFLTMSNPLGGLTVAGIPTMSGTGFSNAPISFLQVNGTNPTTNAQNFNLSTPAAPLNGINLTWQRSGASVSAALVGNGVATNCLIGTGVFAPCPGASVPLSGLTAATATNTINNGTDLTQTWNWALSGAVPGFVIGESVANTNTTTSLLNLTTPAGSFTTPLQISQGVINSIVNVPAIQINTSYNAAGSVSDIFRINLINTLSGTTNTNYFNFLGGTAGTTVQARMSIQGNFYLNGPITTVTTTGNLQLCTSGAAQCVVNQPGVVGALFAQAGDNLNSGAAARAGAGIFRGGMLTNATPNAAAMEGTTQLGAGFLGTSAAIFNTVCMTATAFTVADCSATGPQANVMGVTTSTSNPIGVVISGTVPMNLDNTGVIGDFVCRGTVAAGQNHDNGTTACGAGLGMGIVIAVSGQVASMAGSSINSTVTLTATTPLVMLRIR